MLQDNEAAGLLKSLHDSRSGQFTISPRCPSGNVTLNQHCSKTRKDSQFISFSASVLYALAWAMKAIERAYGNAKVAAFPDTKKATTDIDVSTTAAARAAGLSESSRGRLRSSGEDEKKLRKWVFVPDTI